MLLAHSFDVPSDPEKLAGWSKDFKGEVIGGSKIEDGLSASWAPLQVYNKGKGNAHRLVAQGRAPISAGSYDRDAPSLISTILFQKELAITTAQNDQISR